MYQFRAAGMYEDMGTGLHVLLEDYCNLWNRRELTSLLLCPNYADAHTQHNKWTSGICTSRDRTSVGPPV